MPPPRALANGSGSWSAVAHCSSDQPAGSWDRSARARRRVSGVGREPGLSPPAQNRARRGPRVRSTGIASGSKGSAGVAGLAGEVLTVGPSRGLGSGDLVDQSYTLADFGTGLALNEWLRGGVSRSSKDCGRYSIWQSRSCAQRTEHLQTALRSSARSSSSTNRGRQPERQSPGGRSSRAARIGRRYRHGPAASVRQRTIGSCIRGEAAATRLRSPL